MKLFRSNYLLFKHMSTCALVCQKAVPFIILEILTLEPVAPSKPGPPFTEAIKLSMTSPGSPCREDPSNFC